MDDLAVVPVPHAPLGGGDPTRRFGVEDRGEVLLPGLTRPEADAAITWLAGLGEADRRLALAEVALPVVLTGGAGPHLLDAPGALVLALGPHSHMAGCLVAMGAPDPRHAVGVVRSYGGGFVWLARASVAEAERIAALDDLDGVADDAALRAWAVRWGGVTSTLVS